MTSEIDNDHIYITLPKGYDPPPGKAIRLRRSLYGLKQVS